MKKILLAVMLAITVSGTEKADAQTCTPGLQAYNSTGTYPVFSTTTYTVTNTASDTLRMSLACNPHSITFTNNILKVSGTPAGTVTLWGSADNGISYVPVTSYSVTASSTTAPQTNQYLVNSPTGGNPYTHYMWIWPGTGTMVATWNSTVLIR